MRPPYNGGIHLLSLQLHSMTNSIIVCAVVLGCITVIHIGRRYFGNARQFGPLPPGPPGLPWIGNVIGIDSYAPWVTYQGWAKTYGK